MSRTKAKARKDGLPKGSGKRKRHDTDAGTDENSTQPSSLPPTKKQATERPEQVDYNVNIAHMSSAILADHLAQSLKRHATNSSTLELEEKYVASKALRDTSSFARPRLAANLPAYLEAFAGGKEELSTCDDIASPHTIIITVSGIRAADLTRSLRVFASEDNKIAKFFAKHMKLQANIEFVKKTKIGIGVGTPGRLKELIDHAAFKATAIKRIVIDGSYMDEKRRTIFDFKEIYLPLIDILTTPSIKELLEGDKKVMEILVF